MSYDEQTGELVLDIQIEASEAPINYTVEAENEFGRAVGRAQLILQSVREKTPQLFVKAPRVSPLHPQTVKPDSTLTITSEFEGIPLPEIKWFRNGKEILAETDEDVTITTDSKVSTIIVRNMTRKRAGKYEIFASNAYGESRSSGSVTISTDDIDEGLLAPRFVKALHPKSVLLNDVVILETVVESNPISSFQWFFNSAPVQSSQTKRINSKENKSVLIIECFEQEHIGIYTCRVENVLGSVTSTASIKIVENENELEETSEYISPRFIEKLKPVQIMDGESLSLPCRVIGYPTPKIQWLHNKQEISEERGVDIVQDSDGLCVLSISEVFPEDAGNYICCATNKFGKARSKANVTVEGILCLIHLCIWYEKQSDFECTIPCFITT